MSKADNMLSILWLLQTRKRMTAQQLSEELEIHIRTVYRYIDALCASGVPIIADSGHNGGYSLLPRFTEAPLFFDLDEQKALMQAAIFTQESGYPHGDALNRAAAKLKRYANPGQQHALERHTAGFEVVRPPSDAALEARTIDPYGLVYWITSSLTAICARSCSFRTDRIQALFRTEEAFDRPPPFSARDYFINHLMPEPDRLQHPVSVRLQGKPPAIDDVCRHWLLGHAVAERTDHGVLLKLDAKRLTSPCHTSCSLTANRCGCWNRLS